MTPEEAKAILNVCPPGDETNPDIPGLDEARELAAANPELAAWWEQEKHFDEVFSRKLSSITPPPDLARTIMRGGATIFFASHLIAETTGDVVEELPPVPEIGTEHTTLPGVSLAAAIDSPPTQRPRWLWGLAIFFVAVVVVLLTLIGLFFISFGGK